MRDLLLGRKPKDFDIATSARPQQVKRTFPRNCRIIGRRFKLAHLHFDQNKKILEVATFRRTPSGDDDSDDLLITRDNEFGTAQEDAVRRDFTVNALLFDPIADRIIDHIEGMRDVRERILRTIGDPVVRFREDPVRIIRAAKFAGRLGFTLDTPTFEAMAEVAPDLSRSAPPRMLEEILRLLRGGHSLESFQILRDIGALKVVLPVVASFLTEVPEDARVRFWRTLEALDHKILSGQERPNAVLLGTLFEGPVRHRAEQAERRSATSIAEVVIGPFARELRLPRRDAGCLKRICGVQGRFTNHGPRRYKIASFLRDPYFSEALQLFELTCMASGTGMDDLARWRQLAAEEAAERGDRTDDDHDEVPHGRSRGAGSAAREDADDDSRGRSRRRKRSSRKRGSEAAEGGDESLPQDRDSAEEPVEDAEPRQEGEEPTVRKRRRRRRSRSGSTAQERDEDRAEDRAAETRDDESHDDDVRGDEISDREPPEREFEPADAEAEEGERSEGRSRRRRRRRRSGGPEAAESKPDAEVAPASSKVAGKKKRRRKGADAGKADSKTRDSKTRDSKARDSKARDGKKSRRKRPGDDDAKGGKKKSRSRSNRRGRDESVETLEPEAIDLSAFDVELGPKQVPTFGSIVEGRDKKRKVPRVPPEEEDTYKPPPPPRDDPVPPPPPPDDDSFGDW